ncbi:MAG: hypothetical protein A2W91_09135 [Bacteroidetes bacterium GWF2_38_335]|nr:MAG: hypothetical protein A2W91_09135 [Bacteroidetes bacterium GWF2_38_335]OFY80535.1 MAG: hypothetical protein A2281_08860 [Bacteroidetes bacterium RIFOXYA12_FULL_38_20]HBS85854.1 hypothetical protein [Bacteroidales bacterium]
MKKLIGLLIVSLFFIVNTYGQETINEPATVWTINGIKLNISNYKFIENGNFLAYKNSKGRVKELERQMIFSIIDSKGKETIYFEPDSLDDKYYTIENMRSFVKGGYEGRENYQAPIAFIGGFLAGVYGGCGFPTFDNPNPVYGVLIPAAFTAIVGLTSPDKGNIVAKYPDYANDDFFILGYSESANNNRALSSIKGSLAGLAVGIILSIVMDTL